MGLELPEIKIISKQMQDALEGKIIEDISLGPSSAFLIKQDKCNLDVRNEEIVYSPIKNITRKGTWIFIEFQNGALLLFGEMDGKLRYHAEAPEDISAFSAVFTFTEGSALTFQSSLGAYMQIMTQTEIKDHAYAGNIGMEPDDGHFTFDYLTKVISGTGGRKVKSLLNLQDRIAGLGNVYINDILYEAGLHPGRKCTSLSIGDKRRLYAALTGIPAKATILGGSDQEVNLYGKPGRYVQVMSKDTVAKPCHRCGTLIAKDSIIGSVSYFCPVCQTV